MPSKQVRIQSGTFFLNTMPYSEVCMHMQVAGKPMICELLANGRTVQLYEPNIRELATAGTFREALQPFSFPILAGEAGLYQDERGHYMYKDVREN